MDATAIMILFIVLFLVILLCLIINNSPGPSNMQNEQGRRVYYCPDCNTAYAKGGEKERICPYCGGYLVDTGFTKEEWASFEAEEKKTIKDALHEKYQDGGLRREIAVISKKVDGLYHDIHGMYSILIWYIVLTILGYSAVIYVIYSILKPLLNGFF